MQLLLRTIAIISFVVAIIWMLYDLGFEPLLAFLARISTLLASFAVNKSESKGESLDQRNRRVMLNHVENFWVKGVLEKSLHGAALLELGIKEDLDAVAYPWTIKREATNEILPPGKSMLEIFEEIGMGRSLLILGAPGSGKTTMLLELARQLVECARQDETEPIPVVFNLSSWKEKQTLSDWLVEQLNIVYYVPRKIAPVWVNENRMLLLLDGLDEVKQGNRARCVQAINHFRKEHGLTSFVICSRSEDYASIGDRLSLEGAIALQPLSAEQISHYFDRSGGTFTAVKQLLNEDKALQELAETPLMLSIMSLAYRDREADRLSSSDSLETQRKHVFEAYIMRMFKRSVRIANSPFSKEQTLHYLHWLAWAMTKHNLAVFQIESFQPQWLETNPQSRLHRLIVELSFGLLFGLSGGLIGGLFGGLSGGLNIGLLFGLLAGLIGELSGGREIVTVDWLRWSWKEVLAWLSIGVIVGLFGELTEALIEGPNVKLEGLFIGLSSGLFLALRFGLSSGQIEETSYPGQRLKQTRSNAFLVALIFGLSVGLIGGLIFGLNGGLFFGVIVGLIVGLIYGGDALLRHFALRIVLVRYQLLPWHLISFLNYAVDLIFLRHAGGSYIFVHRLLMEHFAEMDV